jgi:hypothetical protein
VPVTPLARRRLSDLNARKQRSAVTNGRRLYVDGDSHSAWSRRYRDLIEGHVNDLGGPELLSGAQISLVRRASTLELELEQAEGRLSMSLPIDLDQYTRASGHLRRLLESLGLHKGRVARDISNDVEFTKQLVRSVKQAHPA